MSGSFKESGESWAGIIFNTSDKTLQRLSEALLVQTPCWVTVKLKQMKKRAVTVKTVLNRGGNCKCDTEML